LILFIIIIFVLIDFLFIGSFSYLLTQNKQKENLSYTFRCAGTFCFNSAGRINYFSGSYSKVGVSYGEVILGLTSYSYHRKLDVTRQVKISRVLFWKCITIEATDGSKAKIYCESDQVNKFLEVLEKKGAAKKHN